MNEFLVKQYFLKERLDKGIDVHPSTSTLKEFQRQAKIIDPVRYFTIYGCQKCVNELVKFVFDNFNTDKENIIIKKVNFPKNERKTKEDTNT